MEKPTECRLCGAKGGPVRWGCAIDFSCGSIFWIDDCIWTCDDDCADAMRDRIQRAIEVLEGAERFDFVASYMPHMDKRSDGEFMEYEQAEQAIEILKGETDGQTD